MDVKLSNEEVSIAIQSYMAIKGYETNGFTIHHNNLVGFSGITVHNVKKREYIMDNIVKLVRK